MKASSLKFLDKIGPTVFDRHQIPLVISKYYSDVTGLIIAKNTLPATLQTSLPFYLFGQFDLMGGYNIGQQVVKSNAWFLVGVFTGGLNLPFLFATGLNTIRTKIKPGDIILIYTDDLAAPTYYGYIVISSGSNAIASILGNSLSTQQDGRLFNLYTTQFNYHADDVSQYDEPLNFVVVDNIGNFEANQIDTGGIFLDPMVEQPKLIRVKTPFKIDQFLGIYSNMLFACDVLRMTFDIVKR